MTSPKSSDFGVGITNDYSLRVSVATLSKLLFKHPVDQRLMLGLERTATFRRVNQQSIVVVKAQPFGGGVRILDLNGLRSQIGDFRFDSPRSRAESDFRIQIRPQNWHHVEELCLRQFRGEEEMIIESSPDRELVEEFRDALGEEITPDQYQVKHLGVVIEDTPRATNSTRAAGALTVRVYNTFEVLVKNPSLIRAILENSLRYNDQDLRNLAQKDAVYGGRGRANAVLSLPLDDLKQRFLSSPLKKRNRSIRVEGHLLDENVLAVLEDVPTLRYRWTRINRGT